MTDIVALSLLIDLLKFFAAVTAAWGILRFLDHLSGSRFSDHFSTIRREPLALAIYMALRFIGVCTIAAAFVK